MHTTFFVDLKNLTTVAYYLKCSSTFISDCQNNIYGNTPGISYSRGCHSSCQTGESCCYKELSRSGVTFVVGTQIRKTLLTMYGRGRFAITDDVPVYLTTDLQNMRHVGLYAHTYNHNVLRTLIRIEY